MDELAMSVESERWLPVVGSEGLYEVSDLGRVRSLTRLMRLRNGRTRLVQGRILSATGSPYPMVHLALVDADGFPAGRRSVRVHTLVMIAFVGPIPDGQEVRHRNGKYQDPRLVNLRYGTRSDNVRDAVEHGTHPETRKTECPRRHLLVDPNLRESQKPRRDCLACHRTDGAWRLALSAGRPFDFRLESNRRYEEIMLGQRSNLMRGAA